MGTRALIAVLLGASFAGVACSREQVAAGAGAAGASAAAPGTTTPPVAVAPPAAPAVPSPPTALATPAAAAVPEVATATFFRAAGGTATFRYPELDAAHWRVRLDRSAGFPRIEHTYRSGDAQAVIQVMFPAPADEDLAAEPVAKAAAAQLAQAVGGTIEGGKALGAAAYIARVRGRAGTVEVVSAVLASVDQRAAALVVATGTEASMQRPDIKTAYQRILEGLRVGRQIPRPPPHDPGQPLSGVYIRIGRQLGEYQALIFDPRGYVHDRDELAADLDAVWGIRGGALDRYTFDGSRVTITDAKGRREIGEVTAEAVVIDDRRYCEASGNVPARLAGHWAAAIAPYVSANAYDTFAVHQSADYSFSPDGAFGFAASATADFGATPGAPVAGPGVHAQSGDRTRGTYQIANDRLVTRYADGTSETRTIYARGCGSDPLAMLVIGGRLYLRDD